MKTFAGNKTLATIKQQCELAGIQFDDDRFNAGDDHVTIRTRANDNSLGVVVYNTVNGNFTGITDQGVHFSSRSTEHEDEAWFQALLTFFYQEKAPAVAGAGQQEGEACKS